MKFLSRMIILFYVTLVLFLGVFILAYAMNWVGFRESFYWMYAGYHDKSMRIFIGVWGGIFLLINFLFYRFFSVNIHREKIIAFDNPSGRVTVSLMAMEDMIRRVTNQIPEVKEMKPVITAAAKKGLQVKIRLVLCAEVNIPELTARVQDIVKKKLQEMIGIDEPMDISIYVGKIVTESEQQKSQEGKDKEEKTLPTIPFRGYRA